ncbi:glycosyltransferase, partial [Dyadobacter sp. CY261]|uniref:glycosyltransferase n=1 Tax=Dyadobacter sp. CY261 TaxID=2907203 RepID=UPI001F22C178
QEGFHVQHSSIERDSKNPLNLLKSVLEIRKFARENDVNIVHSFKFVPNLINSCANIFTGKKVVLHIAGLGIAFANTTVKFRILKFIQQVLFLMQFLRANLVIIQNPDDYNDFFFKQYFRKKIKVVKGSGVNITKFCPSTDVLDKISGSSEKMVFLCTTRLIWEKGIRELVEAFESLPDEVRKKTELRIIGEPDNKNPRGVTNDYITGYSTNPCIRFLGRQDNIREHLQNSDVFILPSYYREGIPRSILEALAAGL